MLNTPVLFLIFNRPDLTEKVFAQIKKAKPPQLFIAADGPRKGKPGDAELCKKTRAIVLENIDWPCKIKTLLREENLGCGPAVAESITWFFKEVEYGIILEDDCLPVDNFFLFCQELLLIYKTDERVFAISGTNFLKKNNSDKSYFFSVIGGIWGWASWRRAWKKYEYSMIEWNDPKCRKKIKHFFSNKYLFDYYSDIFDKYANISEKDSWDYQWLFCRLANQGLSIVPAFNQVENIGFGAEATHTLNSKSKLANLETIESTFPLYSNSIVAADLSYDNSIYEKFLKPSFTSKLNLREKIMNRLKSYLTSK